MKIGLVLDTTLDTPDGVPQYVLKVGAWLSAAGHEVHYLVGESDRSDIENLHSLSKNVWVKFNGNKMSIPLPTGASKLKKFLLEHQFDILHVQVPYSPFMAGRLLTVAPPTTAVVGTFHILPYSQWTMVANRGLALLNKRSGRHFDAMTAVSKPAAEFAKRTYGYECSVIPNPVDISQFEHAKSGSSLLNIVFLGRLVERKGAQYLLEAVQHMVSRQLFTRDFRVHIGGKGELKERLEQYAAQHQMKGYVEFDGFVTEAAKPNFLAQADIAVYPSLGGESFGIVLTEAMAAARGVVLAGNNPGYASVISSADQLIDPKNIPAFAQALAVWLSDADARKRAAREQRKYVQQFDVNVVGSKLEELYAQVLQTRRGS